MGQSSTPSVRNWAVMLVHGIGSTRPMQMMEDVNEALATQRDGLDLDAPIEAHHLKAKGQPGVGASVPGSAVSGADDLPDVTPPPMAGTPDVVEKYVYIRNAKLGGNQRVRFAEAYWGDISFYKPGFLNLLGALLISIFGVRFFANAATNEAVFLSKPLKYVLMIIVFVIAAFAFPITFVTLIYSLMGLIAEYTMKWETAKYQEWLIVIGSVSVCTLIGLIGLKRVRPMGSYRTLGRWIFGGLIGFSILFGLIMIVGLHVQGNWEWNSIATKRPFARDIVWVLETVGTYFKYDHWVARIEGLDQIGIYYGFMHFLQLAVGIVLVCLCIAALLLLILNVLFCCRTRGARRGAILATVSVVSIWIFNLVILWPENLATHAAMSAFGNSDRASDEVMISVFDPKIGTFGKFKNVKVQRSGAPPTSKIGPVSTPDENDANARGVSSDDEVGSPRRRPERALNEYYAVIWFEGLFYGFLVLTGLLVVALVIGRFVRSKYWGWKNDFSSFATNGTLDPKRENWPRLIISNAYIFLVLLLLGLISAAGLIVGTFGGHEMVAELTGLVVPPADGTPPALPHEISVYSEHIKIVVVIFVVLFLVLAHYIRDSMKLVLDVVNHFTAPDLKYPVRRKIAARFDVALAKLLDDTPLCGDTPEEKPHLVVIAHSQGTVITFDQLRGQPDENGITSNSLIEKVRDKTSGLTIITFGSPLTHIYQRYFEALYPPLKDLFKRVNEPGTTMDKRVRIPENVRWFNVYRIDDYVGTYVENSVPDFPVNIPLGPGGHTAYWKEDVFKLVLAHPQLKGILS